MLDPPWNFDSSPLKIGNPKNKGPPSNHHVLGAVLNFRGVKELNETPLTLQKSKWGQHPVGKTHERIATQSCHGEPLAIDFPKVPHNENHKKPSGSSNYQSKTNKSVGKYLIPTRFSTAKGLGKAMRKEISSSNHPFSDANLLLVSGPWGFLLNFQTWSFKRGNKSKAMGLAVHHLQYVKNLRKIEGNMWN